MFTEGTVVIGCDLFELGNSHFAGGHCVERLTDQVWVATYEAEEAFNVCCALERVIMALVQPLDFVAGEVPKKECGPHVERGLVEIANKVRWLGGVRDKHIKTAPLLIGGAAIVPATKKAEEIVVVIVLEKRVHFVEA